MLVVDNCSAHEKIQPQLKATELLFLPPNATTKLQPLDQGIIQNIKVHYRTANLLKLIAHIDAGMPREDFRITILEAMTMLKQVWNRVTPTPSTIAYCFRKAGFVTTASSSSPPVDSSGEDAAPEPLLSRLYREWKIKAEDYFYIDADLQTSSYETTPTTASYCPQSSATSSTAAVSEVSGSNDDDCGKPVKVTQKDVLDCVQKNTLYCTQTCGAEALLHQFHAFAEALNKHLASVKTQTTIHQFFRRKHVEQEDGERGESAGWK